MIKEAFEKAVPDAIEVDTFPVYLCLFETAPYYGGPEDGGWWGQDYILISYKEFPNRELAEKKLDEITKLAEELQEQSLREYGERCLRETEWCESRGLDADYLPEPNGPSTFFVTIEDGIPENKFC